MKKFVVFLFLLCVVAASAGEFEDWMKKDRAIRTSAESYVAVGDFRMKLPLGWIVDRSVDVDGEVGLVYVGAQTTVEPPKMKARLSVATGTALERGGVSEAWPSEFSGWKTFELNNLWGVRAELPGARGGQSKLAIQIPTSLATLTLDVDFQGETKPWEGGVQQLLQSLVYVGLGHFLAPPGKGDGGRSRSSSRSPQVEVLGSALGSSPLHEYVAKVRQSLHKGVDPATENYVTLLDTGADALLARLHLIRSATESIRIQTFIWGDDEVGRLMLYEIIQAAKRGVKVDVVIDHIASFRNLELAAFVSTVSPNLTFRHYRPSCKRMDPNPLQESLDFLVPNRSNQRMHNKVFIVDNVVAITGGRNIDNSYYAQSKTINFRDRDVMFMGPMVAYAVRSFEEYWKFDKCERTARLKDVKKVIKKGKFKKLKTRDDFRLHDYFVDFEKMLMDDELLNKKFADSLYKVDYALFLADPPGKASRAYTAWRRGTIARQLESVMKSAEYSLVLQTPYLVLDGGILKIFKKLREENPDIKLATSSNSFGATDNPIAYAANFKMRPAYMKAGINIYEYMQMPAAVGYQLPNYDVLLQRNQMSRQVSTNDVRGTAAIYQKDKPFMCIHAKALVVDDLVAFVGSYNFDPRSISLNTEVGLLVEDKDFAADVKRGIESDIMPENSWVVAKRKEPRSTKEIYRSLPEVDSRARIDWWPFRFTSGYELKEGEEALLPSVSTFYSNYDDIGPFPGADDDDMAMKKVVTSISTALSWLVVPLL